MRKLLVIFSLFFVTCVNAESTFQKFDTKIESVNEENATIENSSDIFIGSSGIVIHTFENGISTIIARADVIKKHGDKAVVEFKEFELSTQEAFPKTGILPTVGDKVVLNYLYDRALIVAPSFEVYKKTTKQFKNIEWVHPDIVAGYLAKELKPNPNKNTFKEVCKINSTGIIFFALNNEGYFVDCNNFKTIKKTKLASIKNAQLPFYTRLKDTIKTNIADFTSSYIENYDEYYKKLITGE